MRSIQAISNSILGVDRREPVAEPARNRILIVTWLAYAGFYLCRKNFSVTIPLLTHELGWTKLQLANALFGYSLMYATGQFVNGVLSDRYGARLIVGAGLFVSLFTNVAMGATTSLAGMIVLNCVNGGAQATGWPGLVKAISAWFAPRERGVVMAWWSTNYVLGGFIATLVATYAISQSWLLPALGWRRGFWIPAALLFPIAAGFALWMRNGPTVAASGEANLEAGRRPRSSLREATRNRVVWIIAGAYFFVKATRYSLLFWLPLYFTERLQYDTARAGAASSIFELVGFTGVVIAGYVSDRLLASRRFPTVIVMLGCLGLLCFLQPRAAGWGLAANLVCIGLIGMMTFGPDTLMAGAAVQDAVPIGAAATAAGFVNGVGSLGQLCSPYLVALVAERFGWDRLFQVLAAFALLSGLSLAGLWNHSSRERGQGGQASC